MTSQILNCPACGGPNHPEAGQIRMACIYCGANLSIPKDMRVKAKLKSEKISAKPKPVFEVPEVDASKVIRRAQPLLTRAWNTYAIWTWLRWILPTCLAMFLVGIVLCVALGMIPIVWNLFQ